MQLIKEAGRLTATVADNGRTQAARNADSWSREPLQGGDKTISTATMPLTLHLISLVSSKFIKTSRPPTSLIAS